MHKLVYAQILHKEKIKEEKRKKSGLEGCSVGLPQILTNMATKVSMYS